MMLLKEIEHTTGIIEMASCLKTGQHSIVVIIYLLLPIKYILFDFVSMILFNFFMHKFKIRIF